jgi:hypothetical protein
MRAQKLTLVSILIFTLTLSLLTDGHTQGTRPANDATILYTLADGQLSILIPHRFDVDTGEATDGEIRILKDQGSPPKIKNFPTNSIRKLDLDFETKWVTAADVQRGAHLYINPNDPDYLARGFSSKDLSAIIARAYTKRQEILGPGQ